jgi:hypothetical protein
MVRILLKRPPYMQNRYLGILTKINPSGLPSAQKCACIASSLIDQVDLSFLKMILSSSFSESADLSFKNEQIEAFYSRNLFHQQ